jgi:hypothetical protein
VYDGSGTEGSARRQDVEPPLREGKAVLEEFHYAGNLNRDDD